MMGYSTLLASAQILLLCQSVELWEAQLSPSGYVPSKAFFVFQFVLYNIGNWSYSISNNVI